MAGRLLISALPGERRIAWLAGDELLDFYVEREDRPQILGNIYLGRVSQIDRALYAAFVEIGLERPGFLPLGEAPKREVGRLSEGNAVIVKVLRQPADGKGPALTARLRNPPADLEGSALGRNPPALLSRGSDPLPRLLAQRPDTILVDDQALFAELRARSESINWEPASLNLYRGTEPLLRREGVEDEISNLLAVEVPLPSGGRLLIEPVRTLTAIDVDSAQHGAGRGGRAVTIEEVNTEAVDAIVRQLRLRALSGLIVVDFLTPEDGAARKRLLSSLRRALKQDEESTRVIGLSPSGLAELTRRRGRPPIHELMNEGTCFTRRNPIALAFEALRSLRCEGLKVPAKRARLRTSAKVAAAMAGVAAEAKRMVESQIGYPIRVDEDATVAEYDIVTEAAR